MTNFKMFENEKISVIESSQYGCHCLEFPNKNIFDMKNCTQIY